MEPCSNAPPGAPLQACLQSTLLDSDNRLNETYQQQMLRGDDATRRALREMQRRWLRHRDYTCKVETSSAKREAWLASEACSAPMVLHRISAIVSGCSK